MAGFPVVALLEIVIVPADVPVTVGSKLTCNAMDWPGFRMVGSVAPEIANSAPDSVTDCTVTGISPDDVRVRLLVELAFRSTSPKPRVAELTLSCEALLLPLRLTVLVGPVEELLEMLMIPVASPGMLGSKLT